MSDWEEIPLDDDWEEISLEEKKPGEKPKGFIERMTSGDNPISAFKEGAIQGGTFNFANKLRERLGDTEAKKYTEHVQSKYPIPYYAGEFLGSGPMKATTYFPQIGEAALKGALSALGRSESQNLGSKAIDATLGGIVGGGLQGGFGLLGRAPNSEKMQHFANERAIKAATGGQNLSGLRDILGTTLRGRDVKKLEKNIDQVGKHMFEEGGLKTFEKATEIGPRLKQLADKFGKKISQIGDIIDQFEPKSINAERVAERIWEFTADLPKTEKYQKMTEQLLKEAREITKNGDMDFNEAQRWKDAFKFKAADNDSFQSDQKAINAIKRAFTSEMDEAVKRFEEKHGSKLVEPFREAKAKYGSFKPLSNVAGDRKVRELNNRFVSPSDYWTGGVGAATTGALTGNPWLAGLGGLAGSQLNKQMRERGSSAVALAANKAAQWSRALENTEFSKKFGGKIMHALRQGPQAIVLTDYLLRKDPTYLRWLEQEGAQE